VEFAMVIGVFFLVLFSTITAMVFALEEEVLTGASVVAVRVAAGSTQFAGSNLGDNSGALLAAEQRAVQITGTKLFGVTVKAYGGRDCSAYQAPAAGDLVVCAYNDRDAAGAPTGTVTVRFRGRLGLLVPQALGFKQGVAIDEHATVHRLTFAR